MTMPTMIRPMISHRLVGDGSGSDCGAEGASSGAVGGAEGTSAGVVGCAGEDSAGISEGVGCTSFVSDVTSGSVDSASGDAVSSWGLVVTSLTINRAEMPLTPP